MGNVSLGGQHWLPEIWDDKPSNSPRQSCQGHSECTRYPWKHEAIASFMDTRDNFDQEKLLKSHLFISHQSTLANNRYQLEKNYFCWGERKRGKKPQVRGSELHTVMWTSQDPKQAAGPVSVCVLAQLHLWSSVKRNPEQETPRPSLSLPHKPWKSIFTQGEGFVLYMQGIERTDVIGAAEAFVSKLLWLQPLSQPESWTLDPGSHSPSPF